MSRSLTLESILAPRDLNTYSIPATTSPEIGKPGTMPHPSSLSAGDSPVPPMVDLTDENMPPSSFASTPAKCNPRNPAPKKPNSAKNPKPDLEKLFDVSHIHLEGEEDGTVPVYDTCSDIRKKIRAFLRRDGVTQAALLRALAKCRPGGGEGRPPISVSSFQMFMRQTGVTAGANSTVFYAAYVFFEKVRLRDGKSKTKKREEMERVWGNHEDWRTGRRGFTDMGRWVRCHRDETPVLDEYGMLHFEKRGLF